MASFRQEWDCLHLCGSTTCHPSDLMELDCEVNRKTGITFLASIVKKYCTNQYYFMSERKEFSWVISFWVSEWWSRFNIFLIGCIYHVSVSRVMFQAFLLFLFSFFRSFVLFFCIIFCIYVIRRGGTRVRQSGCRNFEGLDRNPERAETAELADKWRRLSSHTQLRHKQKHKVGEDIDISFISCRCTFWSQTSDVGILSLWYQ